MNIKENNNDLYFDFNLITNQIVNAKTYRSEFKFNNANLFSKNNY